MVTLATGGMGLIPYAAGISAATGVSIGLDDQIRQALAEGRVVAATDRASYHLPFVGTSRNIYAAYQQGAVLGMGFHMGLLSVEAFGLRGALKGSYRLPQGAAKQTGVGSKGNVGKQGKLGTNAGKGVRANPYMNMSKDQLLKSKLSYEKLIREHQAKLEAFKKDPIGNSSAVMLKQMTADNPTQQVLSERAKGRIPNLEQQLIKQRGELAKINKVLEANK